MKTYVEYWSKAKDDTIREQITKIKVEGEIFNCPTNEDETKRDLVIQKFAFFRVTDKTDEEIYKIMKDRHFKVTVVDTVTKILHIPRYPTSEWFFIQILDEEKKVKRENGIKILNLKALQIVVVGNNDIPTNYEFTEDFEGAIERGDFKIPDPVKVDLFKYWVTGEKSLSFYYRLRNRIGYEANLVEVNLANKQISLRDFNKAHTKYVGSQIKETFRLVKEWLHASNPLYPILNAFLKEKGLKEEVFSPSDLDALGLPVSYTPFRNEVHKALEKTDQTALEKVLKNWEPGFAALQRMRDEGDRLVLIKPQKEEPQGETNQAVINKYLDDGMGGGATLGDVAHGTKKKV